MDGGMSVQVFEGQDYSKKLIKEGFAGTYPPSLPPSLPLSLPSLPLSFPPTPPSLQTSPSCT